jgi:hypothetical protein
MSLSRLRERGDPLRRPRVGEGKAGLAVRSPINAIAMR